MTSAPQIKNAAISRVASGSKALSNPSSPLCVQASSLAVTRAPARGFLVAGLIPDRNVTSLTGDGGLGKSLIALHLAVAMSSSARWLDLDTMPGDVMFISAEDELSEIHRRLEQICDHEGLQLASLTGLHVLPLAGLDALLAVPNRERGVMQPTDLLQKVRSAIETARPKLLVIDTLADVFGGNEIDRAQARSFIGILRSIALEFDLGVLLLAHPSLNGMSSGTGSSGSTAWSNSVRSRLYLDRPALERDRPADQNERLLSVKKANYSAVGTSIRLRWRDGVFVRDDGEADFDRQAAMEAKHSAAEVVFLEILQQLTEQGRTVSPAPSASYAPTLFEKHPDAKGFRKKAFAAVMERLLQAGAIHVEMRGPPSKPRQHLVLGPSAA